MLASPESRPQTQCFEDSLIGHTTTACKGIASSMADEIEDPRAYLTQLLNRTLHVHTSDGRMFVGQMKCTDSERNLILAMTHEYRHPSESDIQRAAAEHGELGREGKLKLDMKKRFVGLVVVPGQYITKIELESYG